MTKGGTWWDTIWFHDRACNYDCLFNLEKVTGEILSKKEEFEFVSVNLEKAFD